ncbi:MAG: hypothetical protein ABW049_07415 [Spongiibacteraceae bacterium]
MIDRQWIERHIPHQGLMCLLDRVERWDEREIVCIAHSHARADNPLRNHGPGSGTRLGIATAIEYAAQATAVHGALLIGEDGKLSSGFLASARNVSWHHPHLDDLSDELAVHATRLSGNEMTVLYAFAIFAAARKLIDGRISIFLNRDAAPSFSGQFEHLPS